MGHKRTKLVTIHRDDLDQVVGMLHLIEKKSTRVRPARHSKSLLKRLEGLDLSRKEYPHQFAVTAEEAHLLEDVAYGLGRPTVVKIVK